MDKSSIQMKVNRLYSADIYEKIKNAPPEKKDDIFRYELMAPFKEKWDCYHIPLKAPKPGGYDIVMASGMLGLLVPGRIDAGCEAWIDSLKDGRLWDDCTGSIEKSLDRFAKKGIELKVKEYLYSIFLADPESPYTYLNEGYCGDGGIPGYIMGWLIPDAETVKKLPAALAHETNHNVRYQHIAWRNDVTMGEMLVSEGLAENFATALFGEESLGPWVTKTDPELMPLIKETILEGLEVRGLDNITAYLYGDEMARMQHYPEAGLPYCAGYAAGYYLVKHYLQKTGVPIEEATVLPAEEILSKAADFWSAP